MSKDTELIASQARLIHTLEKKVEELTTNHNNIRQMLYCIGGPLNDNKANYSHGQLKIFHAIAKEVGE